MVKVNFYGCSENEDFVKNLQVQISDRFANDYPDFQTEFKFSQEDEEFCLIFKLSEFESIDDVDIFLCEEICHEREVYCEIFNSTSKKSFYYDEEDEWISAQINKLLKSSHS